MLGFFFCDDHKVSYHVSYSVLQSLSLVPSGQACGPQYGYMCGKQQYITGICSNVSSSFKVLNSIAPTVRGTTHVLWVYISAFQPCKPQPVLPALHVHVRTVFRRADISQRNTEPVTHHKHTHTYFMMFHSTNQHCLPHHFISILHH